jgi:hypothetical protein
MEPGKLVGQLSRYEVQATWLPDVSGTAHAGQKYVESDPTFPLPAHDAVIQSVYNPIMM